MVAVPVLLLVGGNIVFSSQDLTGDERFPYMMGQAQARLTYSGGPRVAPQVDERSGYDGQVGKTEPATPIPGWGTDEDSHVRALSALAGGTVISVTDTFARTTIGRKQLDLRVRGVDAGRYPAQTQGLVSLDSGRWPATATEVVVTRLGIYHGLPSSGTLTVTDPGGKATAYTIVGVGEGWIYTYGAEPADLIALPDTTGQATFGTAYLLDRATPVTWAEVKRWADYGLQVTSRYVSAHPPTREELNLPPGAQLRADQSAATQAITAAIMAIGLLLETTLLVGPAFAVSAARQRRTLALAASNGATTAQLRRSVLAQAIVLGVLAALVGAVAGVLGAAVVIAWSRANRPDTFFGPFEVPGWPVGIVVGCAIASAVIAAMIPSRGLGRLDIVGVMRGQNVSPPALVRTPIAGIVLAGLGALSVFWAVAYRPTEPSWVDQVVPLIAMGGAILLVIGALLLVPMVLVIVARLTRPAPVAIRMAMRDAARQRGRATSTVAAILGGTALLSTILVVAASDSAFRERDYQPQLPLGQAKVVPQGSMFNGQVDERWGAIVTDIVKAVDPALKTQLLRLVDVTDHQAWARQPESVNQQFFLALRTGCTAARALDLRSTQGPQANTGPPDTSCQSLRGMGMSDDRAGIMVADIATLVAQFGLDSAAESMLRRGGIVVHGEKAKTPTWIEYPDGGGWGSPEPFYGQVDIVGGKVTFARGTVTYGPEASSIQGEVTTVSLTAMAVPVKQLNPGGIGTTAGYPGGMQPVGALMTTETAQGLGLGTTFIQADIIDPRGPISADAEADISGAITDNNLGWFYVERGFQPYDRILAIIVLGIIGLIILVATLVSTALSTAETMPMMGTFAAVGATRMTRRNLAAAQAGSLGVVGAFLGVLVGFVPGIAIARASTSYPLSSATYVAEDAVTPPAAIDPTVVIPWLQLAIPVIAVPLLAAALAWLAIRKAPTVTRRLT